MDHICISVFFHRAEIFLRGPIRNAIKCFYRDIQYIFKTRGIHNTVKIIDKEQHEKGIIDKNIIIFFKLAYISSKNKSEFFG